MSEVINDAAFPEPEAIPAEYRLAAPLVQRRYLSGGELCEWGGERETVRSPIAVRKGGSLSPVVIGEHPQLSPAAALDVLQSAVAAYDNGRGAWPTMSVEERIRHVEQFAVRMQEVRSPVVRLLMWEIGKTAADSAREFDRTVEYIRDTVQALKELDRTSSRFLLEQGIIAQVRRAPLGVALCMGPYNYPLNETFTTLVPALIMGNTVVLKPPKLGVLLLEPLLEAFRASFPAGVVNTVYGEGSKIIGPIMQSGKVDVLAFIGSSRVADLLKTQHPRPHRLRSVLGLGAKNPAIVLDDADLAAAAKECVLGALSFNGQRCTALKILFVQRSVLTPFLDLLSAEVEKLRFGMPWEEGVGVTPLPEEGKIEYLQGLVKDAVGQGAHIVNPRGGQFEHTLFFPAVLSPVSSTMRVYHEEQFGPVVPIVPFDDIREAVGYIEASPYGQQASIFGRNPEVISRLVDPLVNQVCRLNLNSQCQRGPDTLPFTGRKDSAEGTLSVTDALRVFSIRTLVAAKNSETNREIVNTIVRERMSKFLSNDFLF